MKWEKTPYFSVSRAWVHSCCWNFYIVCSHCCVIWCNVNCSQEDSLLKTPHWWDSTGHRLWYILTKTNSTGHILWYILTKKDGTGHRLWYILTKKDGTRHRLWYILTKKDGTGQRLRYILTKKNGTGQRLVYSDKDKLIVLNKYCDRSIF